MTSHDTTLLQGWIDQLNAGDAAARNELLAATGERLMVLTRRMLKHYPGVRRWEQTSDVMQNALLRLCRALDDVKPCTVRDYYGLATLQIRRELLDLARRYYGPQGHGAHHPSNTAQIGSQNVHHSLRDRQDSRCDPQQLDAWREFHEQIGRLPYEVRNVFELVWYQGLTQAEAARVLGVSVPTVKRRWLAARLGLQAALSDMGYGMRQFGVGWRPEG